MDNWLRPVFARKQTPVPITPDRPVIFADDNESEEGSLSKTRDRPTSRVSSYIGLGPTTPTFPGPGTLPNFKPSFKEPDSVWIKPSTDQMVEMLKVVMMNQSSMEPVPIQYNSCILHVLEGYYDLRIQLQSKDEAIELLKQTHTRNIHDFEELASAWHLKEKDYQVEVKRLEVLLSKTGGLESVSMARSDSVIHGSKKASEIIKSGIGTIKQRNASLDDRSSNGQDISFGFAQSPSNHRTQPLTEPSELKEHAPHLKLQSQYRLPDMKQSEQEASNNFDFTSIESSLALTDESSSTKQSKGLETYDKPLPDIPNADIPAGQTTLDKFFGPRKHSLSDGSPAELPVPRQMSFSFRPGDDSLLSFRTTRDRSKRQTLDGRLLNSEDSPSPFATPPEQMSRETSSSPATAIPNPKSKLPRPGTPKDFALEVQEDDALKRGDSKSSVITAVRDNSSRSSVRGSQDYKQSGRPRLYRQTIGSSSEAVAAAARALAASSKRSPNASTRVGSQEGSESNESNGCSVGKAQRSADSSFADNESSNR